MTRPEPVVDEGRIAAAIAGVVVAVLGLVLLVVRGQAGDLTALELAVQGTVTAGMAAAAAIAPIWRAYRARAKVTPLEDPRDVDGEKLVPASLYREKHIDTRTPGVAAHAAPDDPDQPERLPLP